ncbi:MULTISPECIES: N-acetyltransferase [Mucilaginibacter]|uniref:N-acetyltransferase n=1 Tax=Mucilaginibacter TaxID=423349 RepID=UPI000871AD03|nr:MULTISPECIES: N-acetyltransferase [Mucilaginibacter]NVM62743.1 N-acetylglutamate synthase-like GNAT family acetyltransferase [Mucilaginibacter sp. SG538B]GGB09452.1 N-acetyltransferase [Mucilaginibacter rubeus]SCW40508.1 Protein N-acetyltransferase, RimJ/RimL family [Mucilaginibacter sp. NFR10]
MEDERIIVRPAIPADVVFADEIIREMESSAIARGSGISKRSAASVIEKIDTGKAIMAVTENGEWVGFSYIETWDDGKFVSNSGLIVSPQRRNQGVASEIKNRIFNLSRSKYPTAKIFSITSGLAIMKMNTRLGFEPVTYAEVAGEPRFWDACKSCVNYDVLQSKNRCNCLCTAMLFDPQLN